MLSMNGKSPTSLTAPPFVLRLSKDERRVFQQNQKSLVLWKDRKPDRRDMHRGTFSGLDRLIRPDADKTKPELVFRPFYEATRVTTRLRLCLPC